MFKIGILGGGINSAVGRAHVSALQLDGNWNIQAGHFSRNPEVNSKSASLWRSKRLHNSLNSFMEEEQGKLDAVIVLTPTPTHYEIIHSLLSHKFNVISEKSLASNHQQAEKLEVQAAVSNCKLFVTFNYTGYPMIREIRSRISLQRYGKINSLLIEMPQETFAVVNGLGQTKVIQDWRKVDYDIPTVSLDLGVHVNNLAHFLLKDKLSRVVSVEQHNGKIEKTVDTVSFLAEFDSGALGNFWFGKSFIGYRNGLRIRGFGEHGSFEWIQTMPDMFWESNSKGENRIIDLASEDLIEASKDRYMRFKPGHPTGFIEAFSNLYQDIGENLSHNLEESNAFTFYAKDASLGLRELYAVHKSSASHKWEKVDDCKK
jgi:predicted dehydrogenase